jgi:superfamily II DNA or RNA helicase
MIFASDCESADEIARLLQQRGQKAAAAHSKVAPVKQAALFNRFCRGEIRFFVSVNMLNEGFDVPRVDMVVLARLTDR